MVDKLVQTKKLSLFVLIAVVFLVLMLIAYNNKQKNNITSLDFNKVTIEYHLSQDEQEGIVITDSNDLNELAEAYANMSFEETTKPMGFPRFLIKFQKDDSFVANWSIDCNQITSGSELGIGNREVINGKATYDIIDEMLLSDGS